MPQANVGNLITAIVITLSAVLTFLLAQPAGTFPPGVVLALGSLNVALVTIARFLPSQGQPIPVELTSSSTAPAGGGSAPAAPGPEAFHQPDDDAGWSGIYSSE